MPLFNCTSCGTIENTACCNYWPALSRRDESVPFQPLCSKCDPDIGEWHGRFPRKYEPVPEQSLAPGAPQLLNAMRDAAQGIEAARADETRSGSVEDESPVDKVDAPPSLPPTGGVPEEIEEAINLHRQACKTTARRPMMGNAEAEGIAYRALTSTILHHLSEAEGRASSFTDYVMGVEREATEAKASLTAAIARAERAEKALGKIAENAKYGRDTYATDRSATGQSLSRCWAIVENYARGALSPTQEP